MLGREGQPVNTAPPGGAERTFAVDVLACPTCQERMNAMEEPENRGWPPRRRGLTGELPLYYLRSLKQTKSWPFANGNVVLYYEPA